MTIRCLLTALLLAGLMGSGSAFGDVDPAPPTPFAAGTWTGQVYGSAALGDGDGHLYTAHLGGGHHFADGLSLNLELVAGYVDATNEPGARGGHGEITGFDLLLRWHVVRRDAFSFYFDGGAGLQHTSTSLPANGTHMNFRPQLGAGFTFGLDDRTRLMTGVRWLHVSNAGKSGEDDNPGFDAALVYAGVGWTF